MATLSSQWVGVPDACRGRRGLFFSRNETRENADGATSGPPSFPGGAPRWRPARAAVGRPLPRCRTTIFGRRPRGSCRRVEAPCAGDGHGADPRPPRGRPLAINRDRAGISSSPPPRPPPPPSAPAAPLGAPSTRRTTPRGPPRAPDALVPRRDADGAPRPRRDRFRGLMTTAGGAAIYSAAMPELFALRREGFVQALKAHHAVMANAMFDPRTPTPTARRRGPLRARQAPPRGGDRKEPRPRGVLLRRRRRLSESPAVPAAVVEAAIVHAVCDAETLTPRTDPLCTARRDQSGPRGAGTTISVFGALLTPSTLGANRDARGRAR